MVTLKHGLKPCIPASWEIEGSSKIQNQVFHTAMQKATQLNQFQAASLTSVVLFLKHLIQLPTESETRLISAEVDFGPKPGYHLIFF